MRSKRPDENWITYQKQWEAIWSPYADGRASVNVPLERAIINLFIAEMIQRQVKIDVEAYNKKFE